MRFTVAVDVMPKEGISDPQGQTVTRALPGLGFSGIDDVRIGKRIVLQIEAADEASAVGVIDEACRRFLTNPIIEDFEIHVMTPQGAA